MVRPKSPGLKGSIHISEISNEFIRDLNVKFSIGQNFIGTVLSVDERYGLKISLKKLETVSKIERRVSKNESDIAIKLKKALSQNN